MASTTTQSTKTMSTTIAQTVKQNPGPAALTALGVGWLVASGRNAGQATMPPASPPSGQPQEGVTDKVGDVVGKVQEGAGQVADVAGQTLGSAAEQASQAAGGVAQAAGSVAGGVAQGTGAAASTVQETVAGIGTQAKAAPSRLRQMVDENPMRLGIIAMALGSFAALAFPGSQREQEMLGGTRDTLVEKAQTTAASTLEKVQQVAGEAGETIEKEAKYQGLAGDDKS